METKYVLDGLVIVFIGAGMLLVLYTNQINFAGIALGALAGYVGARGTTALTSSESPEEVEPI